MKSLAALPRNADPRHRFLPAGGAFATSNPRPLTPHRHSRAPPTPLQRADQLPLRTSRYEEDSPESLGPPCPPAGLEPWGVRSETPNTVIRSCFRISTLASFSARKSPFLAITLVEVAAGTARTAFALSLSTQIVRTSCYLVPTSFRLGTSRDVALCRAPPDKHPPMRSSDVCFPNS